MVKPPLKLCECGKCNRYPKTPGSRFCPGHNPRPEYEREPRPELTEKQIVARFESKFVQRVCCILCIVL